jgi:hypothetical protein
MGGLAGGVGLLSLAGLATKYGPKAIKAAVANAAVPSRLSKQDGVIKMPGGVEDNNAATVLHKDYPEKGTKWGYSGNVYYEPNDVRQKKLSDLFGAFGSKSDSNSFMSPTNARLLHEKGLLKASKKELNLLLDMTDSNGVIRPQIEEGFIYPQDKALKAAQRNASLPVSKGGLGLHTDNTAMERARALGFTDDTFHGSKSPEGTKNLVPGGEGGAIRHGDAYGTGVYTTTDAVGDASSYGYGGAVFPLKINRANHLQIDAPNADDLQTLSKFAGDNMLPSDKARFSIGRDTRQFSDLQDARDFFGNQRENWKQFGDGMDRARPEAIANPDGTFAVQFTNFDAPVPITSGKDADTLLRAVGYDNVPSMGYSGHTLDRGAGRLWDVTPDTSKLRSRFAVFDPMRRNEADLLAGVLPLSALTYDDNRQILDDLMNRMEYAKGGSVTRLTTGSGINTAHYADGGSVYSPDQIDEIVTQHRNSEYDPARVDEIVAQLKDEMYG